ncbi:MAG: hypothetical protein NC311_18795, partial [Muribaculaceae bacterium]|nr:hypothetical protein [Muribaculaceae bacterium]
SHSVSLKADGSVWAWGLGSSGQLGEGTTNSFTFPVQVKRGEQKVYYYCPGCGHLYSEDDFDADGNLNTADHTCVTEDCGTVLNKDYMESTGEYLHHIVSVSAGQNYTLALDMWGNVWAWGTQANVVPTVTNGDYTPKLIDFSNSHYDDDHSYVTAAVDGESDPVSNGRDVVIVAIDAGYDHAVALDSNGEVWAWGNNGFGQLGNDAATYGASTSKWDWTVSTWYNRGNYVEGYQYFLNLENSDAATLSARDSSTVQVPVEQADGSTKLVNTIVPVHVDRGDAATSSYRYLDHVVAVSAGSYFTMALRSDGTVYAWGRNNHYQLGQKSIIAGNGTDMSENRTGQVYSGITARTYTDYVGQADILDRYVPTQVKGVDGEGVLSGITAISAGKDHALALGSDGTTYTWGRYVRSTGVYWYNGYYFDRYMAPTVVTKTGTDGEKLVLKGISAGYDSDVGVAADGSVWTWGNNQYGELAQDNITMTDQMSPIAANAFQAMAGEGPSTISGQSATKTEEGVTTTGYLTNIIAVAAGSSTALALSRDGYIYGWGYNGSGEVGNVSLGDTSGNDNVTTTTNNVKLPMLVGARAANLLQITTVKVEKTVFNKEEFPNDNLNSQATVDSSNAASNDSRGQAVYYAPNAIEGLDGYTYQGEEMPVNLQLTHGQVALVDTESIVEEMYKGYNLHWEVTRRTAENALSDEGIAKADYADRFYAFSSDESIIKVERNIPEGSTKSNGIKLWHTGDRYGTATVVIVDKVNGFWGSFTVTVFPEGLNDDSAPIVTNAMVFSGYATSYAVKRNGTVWAWGDNLNENLALNGESVEYDESDTATLAENFIWKYYRAESEGDTYLQTLIKDNTDKANGYNDDISKAESNYSSAKTNMDNLKWADARESFLAAVDELRDQTVAAQNTVDGAVNTLVSYKSSTADSAAGVAAIQNMIDALNTFSTALGSRSSSLDELYDQVNSMVGAGLTAQAFSEMNTTITSYVSDKGIRNAALTAAWNDLKKNADTTAGTTRDVFEEFILNDDGTVNTFFNSAIDELTTVDELMLATSPLQLALAAAEANEISATAGYQGAQDTLEQAESALNTLVTAQAPFLADAAFYTAIKTAIENDGKPYPGLPVIIGIKNGALTDDEIVLPSVLAQSSYN